MVTTPVGDFLVDLEDAGVRIWLDQGRIRYRSRPGALTPTDKDALQARRDEIVAWLLENPVEGVAGSVDLVRGAAHPDGAPLAFAQEPLWFLDSLGVPAQAYVIPLFLRIEGRLNVGALENSLADLLRRHEVLRARFRNRDGDVVQVIDPGCEIELPVRDLGRLSRERFDEAAGKVLAEEVAGPWSLADGPLIRAILLRRDEEEHALIICTHHIVSDGWSSSQLLADLSSLYAARTDGRPSDLPPLPVQYADYAVWQRRLLDEEAIAGQLSFWREHLRGVPQALDLPVDRPRPPQQTYRGGTEALTVPLELRARLSTLAREHGATLFMVLLSAFQLLLSRLSGQSDLVVGAPVTGRTRRELEPLIGLFVNTLAMRADLSDNPSYGDFLVRTRKVVLDAFANQDLPFDRLVAELSPARDLGRAPLCQAMFALQKWITPELSLGDLRVSSMSIERATSTVDLTLRLWEVADGLVGDFEYNLDIFDAKTIRALSLRYVRLLEQIAGDPARQIGDYDILLEDERRNLLELSSGRVASYPQDRCIHALFEAEAARRPEAIALCFEGSTLSYGELEARANRLAHHLIGLGVGPEERVALYLERGFELVVAVLAVLKAGGAYVPLDPVYPADRIAFMIGDSAPKVVISGSGLEAALPALSVPVVRIDVDSGLWAERPSTVPAVPGLAPSSLAYVIYTSGSTGAPKGVMVEHRHVVHFVSEAIARYEMTASDRFLQFASPSFDTHVEELFVTLASGAGLVLRTDEWLADAGIFWRKCDESRISILSLPTQFWDSLANSDLALVPECVKRVIIGGEAARGKGIERWVSAEAMPPLINSYGPTEATIGATAHRPSVGDSNLLSIGRPISNVGIYLLGAGGGLVPVGAVGEIHIGGAGVARGYWNRPELSAERFIDSPFVEGDRLYRTGDLARWLGDGTLEFLGRDDFQVKVRGYRIELGEIEAVLMSFPGIGEAVVEALEDGSGDRRLVAYYRPAAGGEIDAGALRAWLGDTLPDYMVPAAFVCLRSFALTPSGKVDRRALPSPDLSAFAAGDYVAPVTPGEELLAGIWSAVLGVERVGLDDDFFQLGGHSLLAVKVVSRVREGFSVELPLRSLFEASTLRALAGRIEALRQEEGGTVLPPLVPRERGMRSAASYAQERLWFLDKLVPFSAAYNVPVALRLEGELDEPALERSFASLVERHESLRTRFATGAGGGCVQLVDPPGGFALHRVDLGGLAAPAREPEARRLAGEEAARPFDLEAGPLFRVSLVRLGALDHVLLLTIHHIVSDGWSLMVLMSELAALYEACKAGEEAPLAPLAVQYADYALWQRDWLTGAELDRQIAYWRERLTGAPAALALPTDFARPAVPSHRGASLSFALSEELSLALGQVARREGATLYMLLLTAFQLLLSRWSGQLDVVVGTPVAGRTARASEGLIGFFVNTLAMRLDLTGDPSFAGLLARSREQVLSAYSHQEVPFERLVQELGVERDLSRQPLFQAMFALQNLPQSPVGLSGIHAEPFEGGYRSSKFDLTLIVAEADGELRGDLEYASDLFAPATMSLLLDSYRVLLEGIAADCGRVISALPLLEAKQRQALIEQGSAAASYPQDRCIHALFEAQAARRPEAIALCFEGSTLSYGELEARANRLAHHLIGLGVGPEERVALYLERGFELVVAVLAVLKAGGAYVPLDPVYPADRIAFMIGDSAPKVVISRSGLEAALPALSVPVVRIDVDSGLWAERPSTVPAVPGLAPSSLAYVIYTSGSTGAPKGVMVEHRNAVRLLLATEGLFGFGEDDVWTLFHSFAFDFSVWEIWGALAYGGRLIVVPELIARSPEDFYALVRSERVTILNQTPSAFRQLIAASAAASGEGHCLRFVIFGGEALEMHMLRPWVERNDPERTWLVNMYGITEITVHATWRRLSLEDIEGASGSVIGVPLDDLALHILDPNGEPVPMGVIGELHVGGGGVARGYLNRPELTAERFVADPFEARGRLYRTGDLGRRLAGGDIEYLGRNDFQVKIRGFRIELGEIETRLEGCAGVGEAVVIAREDRAGDKRLVAYLRARPGAELEAAALREALVPVLPDYMVPSAFVTMESFPLTPNGKLDRAALPAPEGDVHAARDYEPPAGPVEPALAAIWKELLRVERVGRNDNFFELGGHSLLVVTMIERLRRLGLLLEARSVFTAPVLSALAERIGAAEAAAVPANLIPAHADAVTPAMLPLARLTQAGIDRIVATIPEGVANLQDIYPLAPLQKGMLFHHLIDEEGDLYLYRTVMAFERREVLDSFLDALQRVIDRHDVLRSAMHWEGLAEPVQAVHRRARLPVEELTPPDGADPLDHLMAQTDPRRIRIDLRVPPLIRIFLARDARSGEWLLALLMHHLVEDNYSAQLILAECAAIAAGKGADLPPPIPYRNFIAHVEATSDEAHEAYFRRVLGDVTEPTMPFGKGEVEDGTARLEDSSIVLAAELVRALREAARREGVTPATLFHVAWAAVVAGCSGREDVVFGTVLSGRQQGIEGVDRMIGMFINVLPVRFDLAGPVRQVVREGGQRLGELLAHEQAWLALARRCSAVPAPAPLFTALLNYRHVRIVAALDDEPRGDDLPQGVRLIHGEERSNYPLTGWVNDFGEGFEIGVQSVPEIDAKRVCRYFETAIRNLVKALEEAPEGEAARLDILPEEELRQLLEEWSSTAADHPERGCVHALFEDQAARRPEAVALAMDGVELSYAELNRSANRLAHHLIGLGVGPEQRVALFMERGFDMIVGLLAVLKAGGAYVPIDPACPKERIAFMIGDSAPTLLLTQASLRHRLPPETPPRLSLDADRNDWAKQPDHNPEVETLTPSSLVYLIYTSGSTGQPKAVMIEHRNLSSSTIARIHAYPDARRFLWTSPIGFDSSLAPIFGSLAAGQSLFILPEESNRDAHAIRSAVRANRITTLLCVPSLAETLLAPSCAQWLESVTDIIVAGDICPAGLVRLAQERAPRCRLHNEYGPTEAAIWSTVEHSPSLEETIIPIGRPVAGVRAYICDRRGRPVPIGVTGELLIGGAGIARGYLDRPRLTAERFIESPFAAGDRLYRTGDIARYRPDGRIEFVGREDLQVKIRGIRIELEEIEAAIATAPGVRDSAVVAPADDAGRTGLVAYYTVTDGDAPTRESLDAHLSRTLPAYMLPQAYVRLDRLPTSPNGKVDRAALARLDRRPPERRKGRSPRTPEEAALAAIWAALLKTDSVGIDEDFFELGGDSLLAMRVLDAVRARFGVALPLRHLFRDPTVAGLARRLRHDRPASRETFRITLRGVKGARDAICFMPSVLGSASHYSPVVRSIPADIAVYGCGLPGMRGGERPLDDVGDISRFCLRQLPPPDEHERLILVGWSFGGVVAHETACQMQAAGTDVHRVIVIDAYAQLDHPDSDEELLRSFTSTLIGDAAEELLARVPDGPSLLRHLSSTLNGGAGEMFDIEAMLRVYRTNLQALRRHEPACFAGEAIEIRAVGIAGSALRGLDARPRLPMPNARLVNVEAEHDTIVSRITPALWKAALS